MLYMKKDVPYEEYAPFYWITDDGRVISKQTGLEVKPFNKHHGYQKVKLRANGQLKNATVARMVALAFIPTDDTSKDVDHIDNDKMNNHVSNLQWLTRAENVAKSFRQGRVNPRKGKISGKLTGLYLSHEAVAILDTVDNKSKFVDKLIKESPKNTPLPEKPMVVNPAVADLIKNADLKPGSEVKYTGTLEAPDFTANEQDCCQHPTRPCKHWQWDTNTGEGYKNILSGRFREAD